MSFLADNLKALARSGQNLAVAWLETAPARGATELLPSASGPPALAADGLSLCSRHDPVREGRLWAGQPEINRVLSSGRPGLIFGLGLGYHLLPLLERPGQWGVFEADPEVARLALSRLDPAFFKTSPPRLIVITPWHLARPQAWPEVLSEAALVAHSPSKRRFQALWSALEHKLTQPKGQGRRPFQPGFKALVVPPLYGGSLYIAQASARALVSLGLDCRLADFSPLAAAVETTVAQTGSLGPQYLQKAEMLLLNQVEADPPDFLLALAQAPLTPAGLARLNQPGLKTAFWFVEDIRIFNYAAQTAPAYDHFFHIQKGLLESHGDNWGLAQSHYLPLAAEPGFFKPQKTVPEPYRAVLSFMGAGYPNRLKVLTALAQGYWSRSGRPAGRFKLFGLGPQAPLARHLFQNGRRVDSRECALIYAGSRINLNLHSSPSHDREVDPSGRFINPRTFEIASAGGFQLVDRRPLLSECFQPDEEVAVFADYQELVERLDYYLHQPEKRLEMARLARSRLLREHTYEKRLAQMLECCYK